MNVDTAPAADQVEAPLSTWGTLVLCCLAQFLMTLSLAIVNVALPAIQQGLGFSASDLQWVFSAYTITYAGFLLTGGRAIDHFGRRRVLIVGLTLFGLASLAGGFAPSALVLVAARAVQGIAAAMVTPATLAILGALYRKPRRQARAFGTWGAMGGAGGAFGGLAGGILIDIGSWHWVLLANAPIALGLAAAALLVIAPDEQREAGLRLDLTGSVLVTSGIMALVFGIVRSGSQGWAALDTVAGLGFGAVLLGSFILYEGRWAPAPLLPFRLFRSRSVVTANIIATSHSAAIFAMYYFLTLFLYNVLQVSPRTLGLVYLPMAVTAMILAQSSADLTRLLGPRGALILAMTLMTAGLVWLARLSPEASILGGVIAPSIVLGAGQGMAMGATTIAGMADVPIRDAGIAAGLLNATRQIGGAIGLAVLATVANERVTALLATGPPSPDLTRQAYASGYALAFAVGAGITAIGLVAAFSAPRRSG